MTDYLDIRNQGNLNYKQTSDALRMLGFLKKDENDINERSLLFDIWTSIKVGTRPLISKKSLQIFLLGILNLKFEWMIS